jgi:hypothetical protein
MPRRMRCASARGEAFNQRDLTIGARVACEPDIGRPTHFCVAPSHGVLPPSWRRQASGFSHSDMTARGLWFAKPSLDTLVGTECSHPTCDGETADPDQPPAILGLCRPLCVKGRRIFATLCVASNLRRRIGVRAEVSEAADYRTDLAGRLCASCSRPREGRDVDRGPKAVSTGSLPGHARNQRPRDLRSNGAVSRRRSGFSCPPSTPIGIVLQRRVRLFERNSGSQKLKIVP